MTFVLEAVYAFHGDALILHYGEDGAAPKRILIDGGARGTYENFLKKRLQQLQSGQPNEDKVPFRMIMVSHTDSDHIAGVLDLFKDMKQETAPIEPSILWHNSFDDVIGNENEELISALVEPPENRSEDDEVMIDARETEAVVQSVKQGRDLRIAAKTEGILVNTPFKNAEGEPGLILASTNEIDQDDGLTLQVLAPNETRVKAYRKEWNDWLEDKGLDEVRAAGFNDPSAFNLASLVVLARKGGTSMLLTGDARGDHIVNALVEAELLPADMAYPERVRRQRRRDWLASIAEAEAREVTAPFHVDLMKVAHHGSANNATVGFFKRVTADHYVFSGNGRHHNPDPETLRMLAEARGSASYSLHFTFTEDQHTTESNEEWAASLKDIHDWVENEKPSNCSVNYRRREPEIYSIWVELAA